ncbi:hypothetical protein TSUD_413370 [Trifolium subterraneum]|uniref:Reverse transcriptase domain-containing protein n=1 Tax=Trifolium subterraneum TaxID=3900 RepID=A0A2Z6PVW9_TRISU|nr:hypothetical protein TSUD_413370 [Trifolium subterraneum]
MDDLSRVLSSRLDSYRLNEVSTSKADAKTKRKEVLRRRAPTLSGVHMLTKRDVYLESQHYGSHHPKPRQAVFSHFASHFKATNVEWPGVDNLRFKRLSQLERSSLTKPFSEAEVKSAVWDCDSYKSPGPDGINFGFIEDFWAELRAFVKDRQILDGILIANEVVDEARKSKKDLMLFKVDFENSYDLVDWGYLDKVMGRMSFPTLWRKWIKECVCTTTASVLVNGSPIDEFPLERGLRQGDPLSPFLFLLGAEGLYVLMEAVVDRHLFEGYRIGERDPVPVSHLQFADDTLLLGVKSWVNMRALRAVLVLFETMSGLKVGKIPFLYLGLPIGGDPRRLSFWDPVLARFHNRIFWVEESLPLFWWSSSTAKVCLDLSSCLFSFFLQKLPQEYGGIGVRQLREFNLALLGEWCWRMLVDREGLWFRVLAAMYGVEGGRLREGGWRGSSWWREIARIREEGELGGGWFGEHVSKQVGDGSDTFFWTDPWVDGIPLWVDEEAWEWRRPLRVWEEEMLGDCLSLLANLSLQAHTSDRWQWQPDPIEGYTVRGAYQLLTSQVSATTDAENLVWHPQVPLKVSIFAWRLLRDRLPTKTNLVTRGIISPAVHSCVSGCGAAESTHHLFISCSTFGSLWALVCSWIDMTSVESTSLWDHFVQFVSSAGGSRARRSFLQLIWLACVWVVWTERNHRLFRGPASSSQQLLDKIKLFTFRWLKTTSATLLSNYHSWWSSPLLCMGLV